MNTRQTTDFDIVIVGYGPSGATFAKLMAQRGYRIAVFDQAGAIYDKPRAITADQEVMRVFQECGLADEIAATTAPHPGTDFVGIEGQVIKRFYPAPPPHLLAWEPTWMFVQPELEATLRRGLERHPQFATFLRHEFTGCEPWEDGVRVSVRRRDDGAVFTHTARYLIGADGGRSAVRRSIDATIEDLAFDEWWMVVDAWLRGPVDLPGRCVQYCRPSRPGTYIVGPENLRRWEIKLLPGETPDDFQTEASVIEVLSTFVDTTRLELCRTAIYRFHALVVNEWRDQRVFLMGDAAHQMPPFLGQGLCAGIRDAVNLAWKIDGVERLGFDAQLLDSYGLERKQHVRTIVSHAKDFGLIIGELDPQAARERDRELGEQLAAGRSESVRQKFIPNLETGLIARNDDGTRADGAGELFVQPWVQQGEDVRRLDDLLPPGFLFVTDDAETRAWFDAGSTDVWARIGGRDVVVGAPSQPAPQGVLAVRERDGLFGRWLHALGARAVIVRPDHYVFGTASNAAGLQALLAQLGEALLAGAAVDEGAAAVAEA
ncbi:bifunctional 3-(3-hydroxy-phenyl)propionate/3-hydroxycinnamic acid hydroxylase [Variovorax sp. YR216]|uniref:bifunctional 3-(3-hydroxy-phenyl)propionate/3-hydroxycinnamic acid hydroxylase n=1 Tax=Variovorax sp. YR216 TaxID=1882828 RepID=UPI000894B1D0|nr:bifunctional 3-(3-hydroxy-phenyl)propionate/3-hydroxycinnamic acid hydroxylase [Variovorax sp. YR216]SEB23641.1 3-(3-hydroxy-phenyl)propionate hydroxylase [Variovorax sp. YR216]